MIYHRFLITGEVCTRNLCIDTIYLLKELYVRNIFRNLAINTFSELYLIKVPTSQSIANIGYKCSLSVFYNSKSQVNDLTTSISLEIRLCPPPRHAIHHHRHLHFLDQT